MLDELKKEIERYLYTYPHVGIMGLAKKSNVSHMTIRRILSGQIKNDPSSTTVLKVLSVVGKESNIGRLIRKYDGPLGDYLKSSFPPHYQHQESRQDIRPDLEACIKDEESFIIYQLVNMRGGTTREKVLELLGTYAEPALDELISKEVIGESEEGNLFCNHENHYLSAELGKLFLPSLIKFFKINQMHKGNNILYGFTESLNIEGLKEVVRIQSQASQKIRQVVNDPNFQGEIPIFSITVTDSFNNQQETE